MNNHSDEAIADESADIARELRTLWHGLVRDSERAAHLDRQQYWVLGALKCGAAAHERARRARADLAGVADRHRRPLEDRGLVARLRSC